MAIRRFVFVWKRLFASSRLLIMLLVFTVYNNFHWGVFIIFGWSLHFNSLSCCSDCKMYL